MDADSSGAGEDLDGALERVGTAVKEGKATNFNVAVAGLVCVDEEMMFWNREIKLSLNPQPTKCIV